MQRVVSALLAGAGLVVLGVALGQTGLLRLGPELPDIGSTVTRVSTPEARLVAIEPISLDCRARVHAQVPVVAVREHELLGRVYRTDRVTLDAVGDVDTCVDAGGTRVVSHGDGRTEVVIAADAVTFQRPRVDAVATGDGLAVEQGQVGKITDALPWVDDDLGLTPLAYAYAQNVIGSSACMQVAYTVTEQLLVDAYRRQLVDQGADPDQLTVRIDGRPRFPEPEPLAAGDVALSVGTGEVTCTADGLSTPSAAALGA